MHQKLTQFLEPLVSELFHQIGAGFKEFEMQLWG